MSKPKLQDAKFPHLSLSPSNTSKGTVTGPGLTGHRVVIDGKNNKKWAGNVTGGGANNVWDAEVKRQGQSSEDEKRGTEDISVTVTNPGNEVSDPVPTQTEVVP